MKRYILIATMVILVGFSATASPSKVTRSDKCVLQEAGAFDKNKIFTFELKNSGVRVQFNLRGNEFFGRFIIQTTPKISNLSKKPKHVAYNIAFFDKDGQLVACTSSSTDLKPNEKNKFAGSNMPEIPRQDLKDIASYQVVIYVTEGKK